MHKIIRFFVMEWMTVIQYRIDLILWTSMEALTPLVSLAVWYRVAQTSTSFLTPSDTVTYYILVMFIVVITSAWNGYFFGREILNGELAKYLTRPLSVVWHHVSNNLVEKTVKLLIPLPLFLLSLALWPSFFSPAIYVASHLLLFVPSLLLAVAVSFFLDMVLGVIAFWLEDAHQIRGYKYLLFEAASGIIIPLALLPPWLFAAASALPFRYIISAPIEILMGQAEGLVALRLMGIQIVWLAVFVTAFAVLYQQGLRRYAVPGQ